MIGIDMKKSNDKIKSRELELNSLLLDAASDLRTSEINYNNSYNSYQEDVFYFEMQAAMARITLITNDNKKFELSKRL